MKNSRLLTLVAGLGLYLVATGLSYAAFSFFNGGKAILKNPLEGKSTEEQRTAIDLSAPKTESCPLNGQKYTVAERNVWSTRRPLGVMIENHPEARPQSGLSKADIVYEAVAEGGITRFLGVYLCGAAAEDVQVGPVRSARTFFLDWISEYADYPVYVHVGGANCDAKTGSGCANGAQADALGQIVKYGWQNYNDLNQFSVGFPTFWRDYDRLGRTVATEHTMYSTTDKLWEVAKTRGLTQVNKDGKKWDQQYVAWKFDENLKLPSGTVAPKYNFWDNTESNNFTVEWKYDSATDTYSRSNGGKPHMDLDFNKQLTAKSVVVAFMTESKANDGYPGNLHLLYKNKGTGKAVIFRSGQATEGTWSKKDRTSRTVFFDAAGKEIVFKPGVIWVSVLPTGKKVEY